jgi:hypothetical protein
MSYVKFDGELDSPASAGGFVPFSGKLDEPAPARKAPDKAAEPVSASGSPEEMGYDALGNPTGSPAPKTEDSGGKVIKELGALRDEVFTGVDQTIASVKTFNAVGQVSRLQSTQQRLKELEASGRGDSMAARNLRGEITSLQERVPQNIGAATEAQADAQRGSAMTTRPAVAELSKAKTFSDAWDIFAKNPYDVIAGVTATSLPTTIPALIAGAVMGPGVGALAMGGSSAVTEAGSSLSEFAQERGVDTTNAKAVQQFFENPANLSEALSYAGKRAGIIGTMDAASGGLASKTLAPKAIKNVVARQAVNLPTQMAAQAAAGAGGEAGAQLATKGKIDSPGQVLMEAVGELGGAPTEVAAFGRDMARAKSPVVETPLGPLPASDPIAQIATAPTVDAAIAAAQKAVTAPVAAPVESVLDTPTPESANASQPTAVPGVAATGSVGGLADPASSVAPVLGDGSAVGPALDAGSAGNQPAAVAGELGAVGAGNQALADPQVRAMAQRIAELEALQKPAAPVATLTPGGMLLVQGESKPLLKFLKDNGISSAIPSAAGVTVGRSQAAQAQALLQDFAEAPTIEASQGATNEPIASQPVSANSTPGPSAEAADPVGGAEAELDNATAPDGGQVAARTVQREAGSVFEGEVNAAQPTQPRSAAPDGRAVVGASQPARDADSPVARAAAPVAAAASTDVAERVQDGARAVPGREQVGRRDEPASGSGGGRQADARSNGDSAARAATSPDVRGKPVRHGDGATSADGRAANDQSAAEKPVADRATRIAAERERIEAGRPKNQKEVSRYNGKFGKGMGHDAAKIEAGRLNRKNDDPTIAYRAEEHGDASLENPWSVVGRKVPQAAPKLTERERAARDRADSPAGRREAEAARAEEASKPKLKFIDGGLSPRDTAQVVQEFKDVGMELNVADTVADLPESGQRRVKSEGLEGVVRGLYDRKTDQAWIVRENIGELAEAYFVAMHESFHRGLARTFPEAKPILDYIYANNKDVRDRAHKFQAEHKISRIEAVEEVLADMAGEGKAGTDIKGFDRLIAFLKDILQKVAAGLNINIPITDEMVLHFVAGMRRAGYEEGPHLVTADNAEPMMSRAPTENVLDALSKQDQLFKLPKSDAKTIEQIAADNMPGIKVEVAKGPLTTIYNLTMPDGALAKIYVRRTNPYGEQAYGMMDRGNGDMEAIFERPGTNPEDVPADTENVYTDVSRLKQGGAGATIYHIAANFAHNTGRIFIGDPNGLSDTAMRRRTEQMLSSALKFGTTRHLAPHPRQVEGDKKLGVPPMNWTYGDDLGNIQSLVQTSLGSFENAGGNPITFDPATGRFLDDSGEQLSRADIQALADVGVGRDAHAGSSSLQRDAILRALSRPVDGAAAGSGGARDVADASPDAPAGRGRQDSQERAGRAAAEGEPGATAVLREGGGKRANAVGLLERLLALAGEPDSPARGVFYSRKGVDSEQRASGIPASDKTATPEFKRWFGDSKVVDAEGNPLRVFHGAPDARFVNEDGVFATMKERMLKWGATRASKKAADEERAFFFSTSRQVAETYANPKRAFDYQGADPAVIETYLAVRNPLEFDARGKHWREAQKSINKDDFIISAKKAGHDGVVIRNVRDSYDSMATGRDPTSDVWVAFTSNQIKSATGNRGTFDPTSADIRFSTGEGGRASGIPGAEKPTVWNAPEPTKADRAIYETQDGRIDLKRAQEAIKESGREIDEKWDARLAETLYPGRVAHRSQQFLDIEARPLLQNMAVNKVTMDDLSDYLLARHAPERNAQVAKVNPGLEDGGAGKNSKGELMTTAAAKKYIADLEPMQRAKLEAVARKVDEITAGTRAILVNEGLEKPETVKAWEGAYKYYAPLFKDEGESGVPHPQGSGFSIKGSSSKRTTGSTKQVKDVLAHVFMQREAATTRAEKNRVAMSLYGLALSAPNPDFWTTIRPEMAAEQIARELEAMGIDSTIAEAGMQGVPTIRVVDEATGLAVDRANPMYKSMPGAITLKVGGEDRVILLNANNERAVRMAESLKNLDGLTKLDLAGSIIGKATRWIASVNTQYNPVFGIVNVIRDTQGGVVNLSSTALKDRKAKVLGNVPAALIGIARDLRGDTARTEWSDLFNEFQKAGGQTGYRELFRDAGDRTKAIEKELKSLQSAGKLTPGKASHAVLDLLDDFNTALENAVRLSAFKAALDMGQSKAEAARTARELTVDFNRKGRATREVGPLYAFFNASVQGTARTIATLKSPAGKKIIAGGFALGALQALMLAAAGFDDDEIPEFIKTRNLIIPTGWRSKEKRFIAIPYPLGLHVLPNTGRVITELTLNGGKNFGKRSMEAVGEILAAFNPMGGGNILTTDGFLKTLLPTVLDPFVELGYNRNFAGNPIEKKPFNEEGDNRPGYARARESTQRSTTGQVYVGISKAINEMTGGTPYEAGAASPTPERVRYLAQVVGGGVLREFEKAVNAAVDTASGTPVKASAIPLSGRFVGEVDADQVEMTRYYEASTRMKKLQSSLKAAEKAGDMKAYARIMKEHPELAAMDDLKAVQKNISGLNKMAVETVENREQMRKIDTMRAAEMKTLNENLRRMEKREPTLAEKLRGEATASR